MTKNLPLNLKCDDCQTFDYCCKLIGGDVAGNDHCDWEPSRFRIHPKKFVHVSILAGLVPKLMKGIEHWRDKYKALHHVSPQRDYSEEDYEEELKETLAEVKRVIEEKWQGTVQNKEEPTDDNKL